MVPIRHRAMCPPLVAAAIALSLTAPATTAAAAGYPAQTQFDQFIVRFKDGAAEQSSAALRQRLLDGAGHGQGLRVGHLRRMSLGADVIRTDRRLDARAARDFVDRLRADPRVLYAEIDLRVHPALTPNDTLFAQQWHYNDPVAGINAPAAWNVTSGSGQVVAVLDTGITAHTDLGANLVAGYDFITDVFTANDGDGRDSDPSDPGDWIIANECGGLHPGVDSSWHGTHVAGTIAAVTNNAKGVAGVAFGAKVQPLRVIGKCGGVNSDIADAIVWASGGTVAGVPANATPAKVLNLSLGGGGACGATFQAAIDSAVGRGSTVVVAAGNDNAQASGFQPASCNNVVTVGAVDRTGARASYSNFGAPVDLSAPGGGGGELVLSTLNAGTTVPAAENYEGYNGTSMATPHVAGVAALAQARAGGSLSPAQMESLLEATTRTQPVACPQGCGAGLLDAAKAVQGAGTAMLSVSGPFSVADGDSGTHLVTFTVSLTVPSAGAVSFNIATENGTATAGSDYVAKSLVGQVIPAGQTSLPFTVTVNGDTVPEADETFSVRISNSNAPLLKTLATTTILDDDPITLANGVPVNGIGGAGGSQEYYQIDVPAGAYYLSVSIAGGSGDADLYVRPYQKPTPSQYYCASWGDGNNHTCTFTPPQAARYYILLDGWTSYSGVTLTATYTTTPLPTLSINDAGVIEGNSGTKLMTFAATLSKTYPVPVTFRSTTQNNTAFGGVDYFTHNFVTRTIPAGQLSTTFTVTINGDTAVESNEDFHVNLSSPNGATLADGQGVGTITNDDGPAVSIGDVAILEGNAGTKVLRFTASLSQTSAGAVTYNIATANGTATAGSDYVARSLANQSIPAGTLSKAFDVTVNGDAAIEPNETFLVNVSNVGGGVLGDGQATGKITNDDGPTLSINDPSVSEGASGTRTMTFTVSLSQASGATVFFHAATANGTATGGSDFVARAATLLSIPAGQLSKTFAVTINGDTAIEPSETLAVNLSAATGATILDGQGVGTITNDDGPTVSIGDAAIAEGNSGTKILRFTVSLSQASAAAVTYNVATANGTATAGSDYVARSVAYQSIPAGVLTKVFDVTLNGDATIEPTETFLVNLGNVAGGVLGDGQATGTITNDDGPTLSIADVATLEGASGTKVLRFTVSLSQASASPVTYNIATANGTATAGSDYVARSLANQSIAAGVLTKVFDVTLNGDTAVEANETMLVNITNFAGGVLGDGQAIGTITNDD